MNNILKSASKLVLLYVVGILGLLSLASGIYSVFTETFSEAAKIIMTAFTGAVTFILGFYFGYKGDQKNPALSKNSSESEDKDEVIPYGGK